MAAMTQGFRGGKIPPVGTTAGTMDLLARITILEQDRDSLMTVIAVLTTRLGGQVSITAADLTAAPPLDLETSLDGMTLRVRP
jgi:hypothetical protein